VRSAEQTVDVRDGTGRDRGIGVIRLLVVVAALGVGGGFAGRAVAESALDMAATVSCALDRRVLATAVEAYAITSGSETISPTGGGADRYERGLTRAGWLDAPSTMHDVTADGRIVPAPASRCG
jgi:hypothetical protein